MDVHFSFHDLASLDHLKTEALCLPFFEDERPLRGAPGLIDWRLCGRISALLVSGRMRGELGEAVLMPARPRLMAERLLWLGAGAQVSLDSTVFRGFIRDLMERLVALRVRTTALVLPGRATGKLDPARAMEWFLDESLPYADRLDEVTVLDSHDAQRAMQPLVDRARRRALADL
jgi:hypothetical protein